LKHIFHVAWWRSSRGWLTTEGGSLLLRQADRKIGLLRRVAGCFSDYRQPERIEHRLEEMLAQRIYGLALGYEDLNDHEQLRQDPLLGVLAGKKDLGEPLAGKSTLNRLELTPVGSPAAERYNKINYSAEALDELLVDLFLEAHPRAPREIVLTWMPPTRRCMGGRSALFPRLLRALLLFAAVCVLRRSSAVCASAALEHRRERRKSRRSAAHRAADSRAVAEDQHHPAGGLGLLPEELLAWCENNDVGYVSALHGISACDGSSAGRCRKPSKSTGARENRRGCSASSLIARRKAGRGRGG